MIRILEERWQELNKEYANASSGRKSAITRAQHDITKEIYKYQRWVEVARDQPK